MGRRTVSIIVMPDDGRAVLRFRLPVVSIYALGAAAAALLGLFLCAVGVYWNAIEVRHRYAQASRESRILEEELASFREDLAQLETRVASAVDMQNRARLLAGLHPLDEETRQLGIGGPDLGIRAEDLRPELADQLAELDRQLDALDRQLSFQERSYDLILTKLTQQADSLARIPTISPVGGEHYLSSGFGPRTDPFTGRTSMHEGCDYSAAHGTPILAPANGRVVSAGRNGELGQTVKVDHGNGIVTLYGHAGKILVKSGDEVRRGQTIGQVGASGRTTGPHLHYEIRVKGRPVNPQRYILDEDRIID